jgi:hypothetical protein
VSTISKAAWAKAEALANAHGHIPALPCGAVCALAEHLQLVSEAAKAVINGDDALAPDFAALAPFILPDPVDPLVEPLPLAFVPDQDGLGAWAIRAQFIDGGSPLTNPDHVHLQQAAIGWLWTNAVAETRGRRIAGEASMPKGGSRWGPQRAGWQLGQWFGEAPTFLITIDAEIALAASDAEFCALIEHELYHCSLTGFSDRTGEPLWSMRAHDVEEFVGVVQRYGPVGANVEALVRAAKAGPILQDGVVALACGTCGRKAA